MSEPTVADILRGAALYLERHGWIQGNYYASYEIDDPTPPACVVGAIAIAVSGDKDAIGNVDLGRLYQESVNYFGDDYICLGGDYEISEWNDHPSRSREDVTTALRNAANDWIEPPF